jgi:hypothetical protein
MSDDTKPIKPTPQPRTHQDLYAAQLLESLSDVVDTLNEAMIDEFVFNFQIGQNGDRFVLASLTCTKNVLPQAPSKAN